VPNPWRAPEDATTGIEIRLMTPAGDTAETERLQTLVDGFTAAHPAVNVRLQAAADYKRTLQSAVAEGAPPDLFYVDGFQLPDWIAAEALLPLSERAPSDALTSLTADFYPPLLDMFTVDGTLYCLPQEFNTLALVYNRDLFAAAQLAPPTESWTWVDLRTAAEAIGNIQNPLYTTYGLTLSADVTRWAPFLYQAGGRFVDAAPDGAMIMTIDSAPALEALDFYSNLLLDGLALPPAALQSSWQGEAFGTNRFGMTIEGNWIMPYLAEQHPDLDVGVTPLPAGPAGRATLLFSGCYGVAAATDHPDVALALAVHLTSADSLYTWSRGRSAAPARISLRETWLAQQPQMAPFLNGIAHAHPWRFGPDFGTVVDAMNGSLQQVLDAEIPMDEVLRVADVIGADVLTKR